MKIAYLAAILKGYKNFIFSPVIWLWLVYTYGVKKLTNSGGNPPPHALTEGQGILCS